MKCPGTRTIGYVLAMPLHILSSYLAYFVIYCSATSSALSSFYSPHFFLQVIQQIPYTAGQHFIHPLVISYNVSMSDAKDGKCPGADEPAFAVSSDGEVNGKISIVIEIMTIPVGNHREFALNLTFIVDLT